VLSPLVELFCPEDVGFSGTLVNFYWSKWHHIPEDMFILSFEMSVYWCILTLKCILCGICSVIRCVTIELTSKVMRCAESQRNYFENI
jgi:hypothetical protein